jgi:hypothetical protein
VWFLLGGATCAVDLGDDRVEFAEGEGVVFVAGYPSDRDDD